MTNTSFLRRLCLLSACLLTAGAIWAQRPHVPGRILVGFKDGVGDQQADDVVKKSNGKRHAKIGNTRVHTVELNDGEDENQALQNFKNQPEVEFAEFDEIVPPTDVTPNDPAYTNAQPYYPRISAPAAWGQNTGSGSIIIAILDTGVEGTHEDLAPKLVGGWNVYDNNANTADVYGHGTATAGTAAAATNNGIGVAGTCWNCLIMPVRISDTKGYATYSNAAAGLNWAQQHGARVANLSYEMSTSSTVSSAAQAFYNAGGIVTVSAGNEGTLITNPDNPYIITVGAVDPNNNLYTWSNYGNIIDLVAPGCVYTTRTGNTYGSGCGTSFSAPLVAGVAGLMFSANPSLTGASATSILHQTADDLGLAGWDTAFGYGLVDANTAVAAALSGGSSNQPPTVSVTSPTNGTTVSGSVTATAAASDTSGIQSVTIAVDGVNLCIATVSPYACPWNTGTTSNGSHTVTATARDNAGLTGSASASVNVSNATDVTPPAVSITSPSSGTVVGKSFTVSTAASDNVAVTAVDLYVDGALMATDTSAPYNFKVNSQKWSSGSHTLQAVAHDAAGNLGYSALVTVTR